MDSYNSVCTCITMLAVLHAIVHMHLGDCGDPDIPNNGNKSDTGSLVGDTVMYTCNSGYRLFGDTSRTCQPNGQWTGIQPQCNRTLLIV